MFFSYTRLFRSPLKLAVLDLAGTVVDFGSRKPVLTIPFTSLQFSNPFAWLYGTMAITVIFLYSSRLPLASVAVVNMDDAGDTAAAAAMCMLIVGVNIVVRAAAEGVCLLFARRTQVWRTK